MENKGKGVNGVTVISIRQTARKEKYQKKATAPAKGELLF